MEPRGKPTGVVSQREWQLCKSTKWTQGQSGCETNQTAIHVPCQIYQMIVTGGELECHNRRCD